MPPCGIHTIHMDVEPLLSRELEVHRGQSIALSFAWCQTSVSDISLHPLPCTAFTDPDSSSDAPPRSHRVFLEHSCPLAAIDPLLQLHHDARRR
jgi:hypothetical protein